MMSGALSMLDVFCVAKENKLLVKSR